MKRKQIKLAVTVSAPAWMTKRQAEKAVRDCLNNDHPNGYEVFQNSEYNFNTVNDYIRARKIEIIT